MLKNTLFLLLTIIIWSCQSNSSKTNEWVNSIEKGESIEKVKTNAPNHVQVNWENPTLINDSTIRYDISYNDRSDFRPITYYLFFQDSLFVSYGGNN